MFCILNLSTLKNKRPKNRKKKICPSITCYSELDQYDNAVAVNQFITLMMLILPEHCSILRHNLGIKRDQFKKITRLFAV